MRKKEGISIPFIVTGPDDEKFSPGLHESTGRNRDHADTTCSLIEYSYFLTSASDYSKFPGNLAVSLDRARRQKLRDRKTYGKSGKLPFWIDKEDLKKYSIQSYFYFDFLQQGMYILLITFLLCGLTDLIFLFLFPLKTYPQGSDPNFIYKMSALNIDYSAELLTIKLSLIFTNLFVVKAYSVRKEKARVRKYLNQDAISQNYFSVLVQGLPLNLNMNDFYSFIASHLPRKSSEKIKQVIILQENSEKMRLMKLKKNFYARCLSTDSEILKAKYKAELERIDEEIAREDYLLATNGRFNGSVIVVLQDTYSAIKILKKWEKVSVLKRILAQFLKLFNYHLLEEFEFQGNFVSVEKVGEPFDVLWRNTGKSKIDIFVRELFTSVILWGAVAIYPVINIIVTAQRNKQKFDDKNIISNAWKYFSFLIWILLSILVITLLINFLSIFSGLKLKTDVEKRKIHMKVAFSFICYGLLIFAKTLRDSTSSDNDAHHQSSQESLIDSIFLLMIYLIVLIPIIELVDVEFLYKFLRKKYYLWRNDFSKMSQGELDEIMAPISFDFSTRVSSVAQIVFLGLVSAPIFPLATPLAMLALYTSSVVDRYLILRRHSDWKLVGSNLGLSFQKAYYYNIFVQVIGALLFVVLVVPRADVEELSYSLIFVVGLGYLYILAGFLAPVINKHAFKDLKVENLRYEEEENKFGFCYEELYQNYLMNGK